MNEGAKGWMDGGILLIFVLFQWMGRGGCVEGIIVCIKLLLLLLFSISQ